MDLSKLTRRSFTKSLAATVASVPAAKLGGGLVRDAKAQVPQAPIKMKSRL